MTTGTLPKYLYRRGNKLWFTFKDGEKWRAKPTPYGVLEVDLAVQFREVWLSANTNVANEEGTFAHYLEQWLSDREAREVASAVDERIRLEKYVLPRFRTYRLDAIKPVHARDLVRHLKSLKGDDGEALLAPRTIGHIFSDLHNVFESALIEEVIPGPNPIRVAPNELPKRVDQDPEWRMLATFEVGEVHRLVTDPVIPMQRRVMYALKSLAGMRHGEAAAACWRHFDETMRPLAKLTVAQSWCSRTSRIKSTKTEVVRRVPVHPALYQILHAWRARWVQVYGRSPTPDDFIAPVQTMRPMSAMDASETIKRDLMALGLRVEAGKYRDRGGHDLRAWFKTQSIEDGAEKLIIRRVTNADPKDVDGGYERFSWKGRCQEICKLKFELADHDVLPTLPSGTLSRSGQTTRLLARSIGTRPEGLLQTASRLMERAVRAGDTARVLSLIREIAQMEAA